MAQTLQNTLYLLTPGISLHRDGLAVRVEQERQLRLSLPIHNLESILVFGPELYVSPAVMRLCWEHDVPICFLSEGGRLEAKVEGVPRGSVHLRRAQHRLADDPVGGAELTRAFIAGKIHNTRWLIARSARDAASEADAQTLRQALDELARLLRQLGRAPAEVDTLRGLEGLAAALAFDVFGLHVRPGLRGDFPFTQRSRRPPRDALNCLLSFFYALLRHDCVSALTAVGLDPFIGFLHVDRAGRESLALDLMEAFRPWVERLALTLINRGEVQAKDFAYREGGVVELREATRKQIVKAYQERKAEEIQHPLFQERVRYAQLPFIQARLLARAIRDGSAYVPHLYS